MCNFAKFEPSALMSAMDSVGVTSFCAPPTVWRLLIKADLRQPRTPPRKTMSAGEPLNAEVIDQVPRAWGCTIRDGFGQTETTLQVANTPGRRIRIGSMGAPLPGFDIAVVDAVTGDESSEGELCLRPDRRPVGLMRGYYGDPERTAEAFRDGLYHTGDIVSVEENGVFSYVGRSDDVFKSNDYKISPFELESVLVEHPAVLEAAIVPTPDELRLAVSKAFVTLAPGRTGDAATATEILASCRTKVAPSKRIRRIEFLKLPKTSSGTIRRVELRSAETRRSESGRAPEGYGTEYREEDLSLDQ